MPYLTFDSSAGVCKLTIILPASSDAIACVNGAISEMLEPRNWEQFGELTPDETSSLFFIPILNQSQECVVPLVANAGKILIDDNGKWLYATEL